MNQQEKEKLAKRALNEIGELHPQEIELIWQIRNKYRFGSIEIVTRDGLPEDIIRTVKRQRLGTFSELSTG
jgi:hypothetical protein